MKKSTKNVKPGSQQQRVRRRKPSKAKNKEAPFKTKAFSKSTVEFSELNDYCIDAICEWLPLKSLAALGSTCSRMNQVCSSYFRRKHPAKHVVISLSNGEIVLSPDQEYVKWFTSQFKNLTIYGSDPSLFEFAAAKFRKKPIKKVSLFAADGLHEDHAKCIGEILQIVEMVEFIRCSSAGGLRDLLNYCSNMKHLVLKSFTECKNHGHKNQWLLQTYPMLEHLHWGQSGAIPNELSRFFQLNPTIKSVYATEPMLPFIRTNNIQLKRLILKVGSDVRQELFNQLRVLDERKAFETLCVICESSVDHIELHRMDNVVGMSGRLNDRIISVFPHLKVIHTSISSLKYAKVIAEKLVHLEEAYIEVRDIGYIVPFIRHAVKLRIIYIDNTAAIRPSQKLSIFHLKKLRKQLSGATSLTVYLLEEAYLQIKGNSVYSHSTLVQVKPLEMHITNNPFVSTFLSN